MKGKIHDINVRNGSVAVLTGEHSFTVFELLTGRAEVGDEVSWREVHPEGIRSVLNLTRDNLVRVLFRRHDVVAEHLRKLMEEP